MEPLPLRPSTLLLPSSPTAAMVAFALREGVIAVSKDEATMLLEKWTCSWTQREDSHHVDDLASALLDLGADPFKTPLIMQKWTESGKVDLIKRVLLLREPADYPKQEIGQWLSVALTTRNHELIEVLLGWGVPQVLDIKGNTPLHEAMDKESACILLRHGADPSLVNTFKKFPIERWGAPWENARHARSSDMDLWGFCLANMATKKGLHQPGFDAAPALLAGFGRARAAIACAGLSRNGFENTTCVGFPMGVSVLGGWCWSVMLGSQRSWPSPRESRILLERCFDSRDGIWDHEWVFATAALDVMEQARLGGLSGVCAPIKARQEELAALPSLDGGAGSRWSRAVGRLTGQANNDGALSRLATATLRQWFQALAMGREMSISPGSIQRMNEIATVNPGIMSTAASYKWGLDIPHSFWEKQGDTCPQWLTLMPQELVIRHIKNRMNQGRLLPAGLSSTPYWPNDMLAALAAYQLSTTTPPVSSGSPRRRM